MLFSKDKSLHSMKAVRRRRARVGLGILAIVLTPIACCAPEFELPFEAPLRAGMAALLRPAALVTVARAGEVARADLDFDARDVALTERFLASLDRQARGQHAEDRLRLVTVLRTEGARKRPTTLVLAATATAAEAAALAGAPVVHGEDLVGFVVANGSRADAQLRVQTIDHVPTRSEAKLGQTKRRLVAIAHSAVDSEAPALRLLVEAGHAKDPFRLRVLRAAPQQLETWAEGVAPYIARTMASERLQPGLPEGLVLGSIEDVGYRERAFVLSRYVEPRFDARSLVRVGILGTAALTSSIEDPRDAGRGVARLLWSSPLRTPWRRALLVGKGMSRGAAVIDGLRCLGRVAWSAGGVAGAVALCEVDARVPLVLMQDDATKAIYARGDGVVTLADGTQLGRFEVEHPGSLDVERWRGAWVYSGVDGASFPHGLVCGRVREATARSIDVELFGLAPWPDAVAWVRPAALPSPRVHRGDR